MEARIGEARRAIMARVIRPGGQDQDLPRPQHGSPRPRKSQQRMLVQIDVERVDLLVIQKRTIVSVDQKDLLVPADARNGYQQPSVVPMKATLRRLPAHEQVFAKHRQSLALIAQDSVRRRGQRELPLVEVQPLRVVGVRPRLVQERGEAHVPIDRRAGIVLRLHNGHPLVSNRQLDALGVQAPIAAAPRPQLQRQLLLVPLHDDGLPGLPGGFHACLGARIAHVHALDMSGGAPPRSAALRRRRRGRLWSFPPTSREERTSQQRHGQGTAKNSALGERVPLLPLPRDARRRGALHVRRFGSCALRRGRRPGNATRFSGGKLASGARTNVEGSRHQRRGDGPAQPYLGQGRSGDRCPPELLQKRRQARHRRAEHATDALKATAAPEDGNWRQNEAVGGAFAHVKMF
eukprot:scaffold754_cov248-Pinguiococcus_pyrenoidosus.AAC.18